MIVTTRLEAEGTTLDEVVKDIEAATKALKLSKDMHVHDEHYERVHEACFKGRRVFKRGLPSVPINHKHPFAQQHYLGALQTFSGTTAVSSASVAVPPNPRKKNEPRAA